MTVSTENVITLMEGVIAVIEGINRIHRASLYSEIFRERVILVLEGVRVLIEKVIVFIEVLLIIIEGVIILSMMNLYSYSVVNNRGCTCRYGGCSCTHDSGTLWACVLPTVFARYMPYPDGSPGKATYGKFNIRLFCGPLRIGEAVELCIGSHTHLIQQIDFRF